jgi:hypothetical protein
MESPQQRPDVPEVSSNGRITPRTGVADETPRVMKAFRRARDWPGLHPRTR